MKLHTVFVSYNRVELTKRAVESYLDTVTVPYTYIVIDNASTDGTREWLHDGNHDFLILDKNRYPGFATNTGWSFAPHDATHFHRADNDFIFLPDWCREVMYQFGHIHKLGQLGLRTNEEETSSINVGGNCVVAGKLWQRGLRWDERPWPQIRDEVGVGWTEDSLMGQKVRDLGWNWARVRKPCIQPISVEVMDDPYYKQTWADRGLT